MASRGVPTAGMDRFADGPPWRRLKGHGEVWQVNHLALFGSRSLLLLHCR